MSGVWDLIWFEKSRKISGSHKKFPKNLASYINSFTTWCDFLCNRYMAASKKRVIKSLDALNEELKDLMRHQYPNGYEGSITRIVTGKKEPIFVFPLETDEAVYLIKLPATKNSDGEYDVEPAEKGEFTPKKGVRAAADDEFGDNSEDNFDAEREGEGDSDSEEESSDSEYDEEKGNKRGREASYDPDFDG